MGNADQHPSPLNVKGGGLNTSLKEKPINLHVATSPITNRIYAGRLLKDGATWGGKTKDVTGQACAAVAQYVLAAGGATVVTCNGKPAYRIVVQDLTGDDHG